MTINYENIVDKLIGKLDDDTINKHELKIYNKIIQWWLNGR
jgi:hypothetical protein